MKTNVLLSTLVLTMSLSSFAQVTDGDGPGNASKKVCRSSDPALSADVDCVDHNGYMILTNIRFKSGRKKYDVLANLTLKEKNRIAGSICEAFGADPGSDIVEIAIDPTYLLTNGAIYSGKDKTHIKRKSYDLAPIEQVTCVLKNYDDSSTVESREEQERKLDRLHGVIKDASYDNVVDAITEDCPKEDKEIEATGKPGKPGKP